MEVKAVSQESPKIGEVISKVLALTKEGKLSWEPTAVDDEFQAGLPNHSVTIWSHPSGIGHLRIQIHDRLGRTVDELQRGQVFRKGPDDPLFSQLFELYGLARRQALNAEQEVSSLLAELDKIAS